MMDSFELVNSLQALPETNPVAGEGIQFGPTCTNLQGAGSGDCLVATIGLNVNVGGVLQTLVGGIGIGVGILGQGVGIGC